MRGGWGKGRAGLAGVYNVALHYEHEANRGVHHLSAMERAMGGSANFAQLSPAVIVGLPAEDALPPSSVPYYRCSPHTGSSLSTCASRGLFLIRCRCLVRRLCPVRSLWL